MRSTFIVGFPGERPTSTSTYLEAWIGRAELDRVGFFTYSREDGTPGAELAEQVPEREKRRGSCACATRSAAPRSARARGASAATRARAGRRAARAAAHGDPLARSARDDASQRRPFDGRSAGRRRRDLLRGEAPSRRVRRGHARRARPRSTSTDIVARSRGTRADGQTPSTRKPGDGDGWRRASSRRRCSMLGLCPGERWSSVHRHGAGASSRSVRRTDVIAAYFVPSRRKPSSAKTASTCCCSASTTTTTTTTPSIEGRAHRHDHGDLAGLPHRSVATA